MSTSTISFSQAPPITSMEPAFRLRMRGDLLGRPGPSGGWGEVCNARSGSSDAFLGHRFSMLPWSVFISSFYATTGTGDVLMAPRLLISDFANLLPHCTVSKFPKHLVPKSSSPKSQHSDPPQKRLDGIHSQLVHCLLPRHLSLQG